MFAIDTNTFFLIALIFGIFWVIVEGAMAYFVYKGYRILEKYLSKK